MTFFAEAQRSIGFTLLEITVVITLIGILAAAGIGTFNEIREQARDERRAADIQQLQIAIEAYKDAYGVYPTQGCGAAATWTGPGPHPASWGDECEDYITGLVPDFIAQLPKDPLSEYDDNKGFLYRSNGTDYKLLVHNSLERKFVSSYEDPLARCPRSCLVENPTNTYCNTTINENPQRTTYGVYSAGAICW